MARILLVKPNVMVRRGFDLQSKKAPPIGLALLAGTLKHAGHEVRILDMVAQSDAIHPYRKTHLLYGMSCEELLEVVAEFKPLLIGFTGFTTQHTRIKELVAAIKAADPCQLIVLGGINATSRPRYALETTKADYVLQGEAEIEMLELVEAVSHGDLVAVEAIDGVAFRREGEVVVKPKLQFVKDLDKIHLPARELLPNEQYLADQVAMPVITSRSCPKRCTFCSVHLTMGYKWRARSPENVIDEIEEIVERFGYRTLSIFDDACNVVPARLEAICRGVVERGLDVRLTFPSGLIIEWITRDLLYWMKRAGAVSLSLPVEHPSARMRNDVIRKKLDIEEVYPRLEWCRELKLLSIVNLVLGMPGETEESLREAEEFVRDNAYMMDSVSIYVATPFPGTRFFEECIEQGYLENPGDDVLAFDCYTAHINTPSLSAAKVQEAKTRIEEAFLGSRGADFPLKYLRAAIRKPTAETNRWVEQVYFREHRLAGVAPERLARWEERRRRKEEQALARHERVAAQRRLPRLDTRESAPRER